MEKTPEELRVDAAELLRRADEIERVRKEQQPPSPKPQTESQKPQADTPDYGPWTATTICNDPDKKEK